MSDATPDKSRRAGPGFAIKAILVLQLVLGLLLFSGDLLRVLPRVGPSTDAPGYDRPVAPGDQTRRFDPRELPARPFESVETGPMPRRILLSQEGTTVTLTGEIAQGDGQRFADFLSTATGAETLVLMSPGGSVAEALSIGRATRAAGLSTEIPEAHVCLSACPYVFAAGVTRRAHETAQIGVHQHYYGQSAVLPAWLAVEDIQRGQAEVMGYLEEMGVDPLLMRHGLATPPDEIYIFVEEELRRYRLTTEAENDEG